MQPRSRYLVCAGYEIHYTEWGAPDAPVVVAWHGLARTGRDMDPLAAHLAARYRVLCPDMLGRGLSQWSARPKEDYCLAFYAHIAADFFRHLQIEQAHWIGTSMGGALGIACASGLAEPALKGAIRSLVLNDSAPEVAAPAVARIRAYASAPPVFGTVTELETFFRRAYAPYGWLPDAQWRALTESSVRRLLDGRVTPHYDPAMMCQFTAHDDDYRIWNHYDALDLPVLCLRGAESDLVLRETIELMRHRGPGAAGRLDAVEVAGCGHAPALNTSAHWELVDAFLQRAEDAGA